MLVNTMCGQGSAQPSDRKNPNQHFQITTQSTGTSCAPSSGYVVIVKDCKLGYGGPQGRWPFTEQFVMLGPHFDFKLPPGSLGGTKGPVTITNLVAPPFSNDKMIFSLVIHNRQVVRNPLILPYQSGDKIVIKMLGGVST